MGEAQGTGGQGIPVGGLRGAAGWRRVHARALLSSAPKPRGGGGAGARARRAAGGRSAHEHGRRRRRAEKRGDARSAHVLLRLASSASDPPAARGRPRARPVDPPPRRPRRASAVPLSETSGSWAQGPPAEAAPSRSRHARPPPLNLRRRAAGAGARTAPRSALLRDRAPCGPARGRRREPPVRDPSRRARREPPPPPPASRSPGRAPPVCASPVAPRPCGAAAPPRRPEPFRPRALPAPAATAPVRGAPSDAPRRERKNFIRKISLPRPSVRGPPRRANRGAGAGVEGPEGPACRDARVAEGAGAGREGRRRRSARKPAARPDGVARGGARVPPAVGAEDPRRLTPEVPVAARASSAPSQREATGARCSAQGGGPHAPGAPRSPETRESEGTSRGEQKG